MHPYAAHMPARAAYAAWGGEPSMAPSSYVPSSDVKRARPQSFCGVSPSGWAGSSGSVAWGASTATKPVVPAWAGPSTAAAPSGMTSPRRSLMQRPYSAASSSSTSSDNPDRVIVQVTRDNEHFSVVNVTGLDTAPAIRECILRKLQLPPDFSCWGFWRTEIGADVVQSPLIDDDTLLALCLQLGDDRGTVKFYVAPMEHRATFSGEPRYALRATSSPEMHRPASGTLVHDAVVKGTWPVPTTPRRSPVWSPNPGTSAVPSKVYHSLTPSLQPGMVFPSADHERAPPSLQPANRRARQVSPVMPEAWLPTRLPPARSADVPQSPTPRHKDEHNTSSSSTLGILPGAPAHDATRPLHSRASDTSGETPPPMSASSSAPATSPMPSTPAMHSARLPSLQRAADVPPPPAVESVTESSPLPLTPAEQRLRVPPKVRAASYTGDTRPVIAQPTHSSSSLELGSAYPLFKSESDSHESGPRPLPVVPSTSKSADDSHEITTPAVLSAHEAPQPAITAEGLANMQHLISRLQTRDQEFDSFSDDTLGGTFAQSLDASTITGERDTVRSDRTVTTPRSEHGPRPVLTLAISPGQEQAPEKTSPKLPSVSDLSPKHKDTGTFMHDNNWASRPPAEQLYEKLDDLFPRHDLDRPLTDTGASLNSVALAPKRALKPTLTRDQHSIRVIAQQRRQFLERTRQAERRRAPRDQAVLARRRSTKLWGGRMVEMRSNGTNSVGIVPAGTNDSVGSNESVTQPVFKWVKGDLIGKGTYGRVYLALNATAGEMIAVKQVELPRTAADRDSSRQRNLVTALKSEIETLKDLDHPNVVTCLGFEETADTLSIFLEYVPGGSIGSCLRRHGKFEEDTASSFLNQTLQGLAYLHKQGILHRDLKADNLLVDFQGTCKISDFGTVRRSDHIYDNVADMSLQGSIFWMAPEVVSLSRKGYSAKVDIWSLGCVVLEMLAGRRPWSDEEAVQAMFKIGAERRAPPVPPDVKLSKPAAHFLRNCFEIDPDRRPTAARLLEHVFAWPSPDWRFEDSALWRALSK